MSEQQWKLVPVPATEEMVRAAFSRDGAECDPRAIVIADYLAMIEAAPQPPALGGEMEVYKWTADGMRPDEEYRSYMKKAFVFLKDHRAHVARLQAEVERLGQRIEDEAATHIAEELKTEARSAELEGLLLEAVDEMDDFITSGLSKRIRAKLAEGAKS